MPGWVAFAKALAAAWGVATAALGFALVLGATFPAVAEPLGGVALGVGGMLAILGLGFGLLSALARCLFAPRGRKLWELKFWGVSLLAGLIASGMALVLMAASYSFIAAAMGGGGVPLSASLLLRTAVRGAAFWACWLAVARWFATRPVPSRRDEVAALRMATVTGWLGVSMIAGKVMVITPPMVPNGAVAVWVVAVGVALVAGGSLMARAGFRAERADDPQLPTRLFLGGVAGLVAGLIAVAGDIAFLILITVPFGEYDLGDWAPDPQQTSRALEFVMGTAPLILVAGAAVTVAGLRARTLLAED